MPDSSFKEANLQALLERAARNEGFQRPRFSIESATKPGENFVGRLFRVQVTEEGNNDKSLSLIIKASSPNKTRQVVSGARFRCESAMYEVIFPSLNDFLKKHGVSDSPRFPGTARCFGSELNTGTNDDLCDAIILEDLRPQGYSIVDIKEGMGPDHCRLVLEKLALLHAASMALFALEPETADRLRKMVGKGYCTGDAASVRALMDDLKAGYLTGLGLLDEPYRKGNSVYDRLYEIYEHFGEEIERITDPPEDLCCIAHGDCWSNNFLFRSNEDGSAAEVCIIDFQTTAKNSPATDIGCALLVCTTKETRDKHYEDFLRHYHGEVTRVLRACGCDPEKIFPWERLQNHMRSYARLGLIMTVFGLPVVLADTSDIHYDIHAEDSEAPIFSGTAHATDPETMRIIKERLTGVVEDVARLGYI